MTKHFVVSLEDLRLSGVLVVETRPEYELHRSQVFLSSPSPLVCHDETVSRLDLTSGHRVPRQSLPHGVGPLPHLDAQHGLVVPLSGASLT